ncbi:hypothetical protein MTO96_015264 [Rhipicephalus appendiculatus]
MAVVKASVLIMALLRSSPTCIKERRTGASLSYMVTQARWKKQNRAVIYYNIGFIVFLEQALYEKCANPVQVGGNTPKQIPLSRIMGHPEKRKNNATITQGSSEGEGRHSGNGTTRVQPESHVCAVSQRRIWLLQMALFCLSYCWRDFLAKASQPVHGEKSDHRTHPSTARMRASPTMKKGLALQKA